MKIDDEEVVAGGVYSGQSVLVGLHCVMVTVWVRYMVLVVVSSATADKALAAKTTSDEVCISTVASSVSFYLKSRKKFGFVPAMYG